MYKTPRLRALVGLIVALAILTLILPPAPRAAAFGTINGLGQRAEHERITRAALACAPGLHSTGDCFEPRSMDQLAGHTGTFGAVGAPDSDEFSNPNAHCDDADFLNVPGYPQTRAQATDQLQACIDHLSSRFQQGRDAAASLLTADGTVSGEDVDLSDDCTFFLGVPGRAKCNALEGFGRALHGAQDFYAHSNWADEADPTAPISIDNPPGLGLPGPSPLLDLRGAGAINVPDDLSTGFYKGAFSDECPGTDGRITHACLNKDKELISEVSGMVTDPRTPRGQVGDNAQAAVTAAIAETRRQWDDFRAELIATYGSERGGQIILALVQDAPGVNQGFPIGEWLSHAFVLTVENDGHATASWRTYQWCADGVDGPCDRMEGNQIINGGHAEILFDVLQPVLSGQVLMTTDPNVLTEGPVVLSPMPDGTARLEHAGGVVQLCLRSALGNPACGA